tara:strand:- start:1149 stop:1691 length:543 start_codon:yes stop_codon:yes gene_type:complete
VPVPNDFDRDNNWQRCIRDRILAPHFYGKYATDGRYVFIDKGRMATILQRQYAVDTIVQGKDGSAVCIEEKIVRWPGKEYQAVCLETDSCTKQGHESLGWMHYGQADFLLYCFCNADETQLRAFLFDFQKLKEWFWEVAETLPGFGPLNTFNATKGRLADLATIEQAGVPMWSYQIPGRA